MQVLLNPEGSPLSGQFELSLVPQSSLSLCRALLAQHGCGCSDTSSRFEIARVEKHMAKLHCSLVPLLIDTSLMSKV